MKKPFVIRKPFFVLLMPLFMAVLCEKQDDVPCGFEDFEGFDITVENTQETYNIDETIWFNATASSMLVNGCNGNTLEIVEETSLFRDSLFVLKLIETNTETNAEIGNATVVYDIGSAFSFDSCDEAVNVAPLLSTNDENYNYKLGFSFSEPGDYCVVLGRHTLTTINNSINVNLDLYDTYSNADNTIRYDSCNANFIRTLDSGVYFFSVQ